MNYRAIHQLTWMREHLDLRFPLPNAERIGAETISLPLYDKLTDAEVERVGEALAQAIEDGAVTVGAAAALADLAVRRGAHLGEVALRTVRLRAARLCRSDASAAGRRPWRGRRQPLLARRRPGGGRCRVRPAAPPGPGVVVRRHLGARVHGFLAHGRRRDVRPAPRRPVVDPGDRRTSTSGRRRRTTSSCSSRPCSTCRGAAATRPTRPTTATRSQTPPGPVAAQQPRRPRRPRPRRRRSTAQPAGYVTCRLVEEHGETDRRDRSRRHRAGLPRPGRGRGDRRALAGLVLRHGCHW